MNRVAIVMGLLGLFLGFGGGVLATGGNGGEEAPSTTPSTAVVAGDLSPQCIATIGLANEALLAALQAVTVAQARATAADPTAAPPESSVVQAVGQANAARQQYEQAKTGCEGAP